MCGKYIAFKVVVSLTPVSRVHCKASPSRLSQFKPSQPVRRYLREHLGEMIHLDITVLVRFNRVGHRISGDRKVQSNSRGVGWEYVHMRIDDHSGISFTGRFPDQKATSAIAFLEVAVAYYNSVGFTVTRVMTDNGQYQTAFAIRNACKHLGVRHIGTRLFTPRTNHRDERFTKTIFTEWPYNRVYSSSD